MKPTTRNMSVLASLAVVAILAATHILTGRVDASNCSWPYSGDSVPVEYR